jgi:hypothetical protein
MNVSLNIYLQMPESTIKLKAISCVKYSPVVKARHIAWL